MAKTPRLPRDNEIQDEEVIDREAVEAIERMDTYQEYLKERRMESDGINFGDL